MSGKSCKGGKGGKGSKKGGMGYGALVVAMVLCLSLVGSGFAQERVPLVTSGTSAFIMATGWSEQPFQSFEGGLRAGLTLPLETDRGLYLRTAYQSLNLTGGDLIQSVEIMPLLSWYVGTKWEVYLTGGLTGYVGGDNTGFDATGGFGAARRLWTQPQVTSLIPASVDVFGEISFTDAGGQPSGGMAQLSIGLRLNKAGN